MKMIVLLIFLHKIFGPKRILKSSFFIVLTEVCYQKIVLKIGDFVSYRIMKKKC